MLLLKTVYKLDLFIAIVMSAVSKVGCLVLFHIFIHHYRNSKKMNKQIILANSCCNQLIQNSCMDCSTVYYVYLISLLYNYKQITQKFTKLLTILRTCSFAEATAVSLMSPIASTESAVYGGWTNTRLSTLILSPDHSTLCSSLQLHTIN